MPSNDIYTSETKETIRPTRLYIKQHSITGLKYFGKTISANPYKYLGSGTRWLNHIRKHGTKFVETIWVSEPYTNAKLIEEAALKFSIENDIVKSAEWANLKPEDGLDGRYNVYNFSKEGLEKCRQCGIYTRDNKLGLFSLTKEERRVNILKTQNTMLEKYGVKSPFSFLNKDPEFQAKRKEKFAKIGYQQGEKNSQFGMMWITNGIKSTKIKKEDIIPDGWRKGRIMPKK